MTQSHDRDAPALLLKAVGSGREVVLARPGVTLVLICFVQESQAATTAVEAAVRERWPEPSQVLVGFVVDLHKVPGMFRRVAEGILSGEHKAAVAALKPGQDPADHVVILPDWDGAATKALGFADVGKQIGMAVIDGGGHLTGAYQGPHADTEAVRLVAQALP